MMEGANLSPGHIQHINLAYRLHSECLDSRAIIKSVTDSGNPLAHLISCKFVINHSPKTFLQQIQYHFFSPLL